VLAQGGRGPEAGVLGPAIAEAAARELHYEPPAGAVRVTAQAQNAASSLASPTGSS